ncbi:MAG: hypothetical protein NTX79_03035 [Candidatus Micrarchaeota archaeon]|nr:hypothetical protein [Candidatus Micrarchaeota archaeon]
MADAANVVKKGTGPKMLVFAAVVIVAVLAAAGYYGGFFGGAAPPAAQPNPAVPLATQEARLLLASYDRGAALTVYSMDYFENDNGIKTNYSIAYNGSEGYVSVQDDASGISGFFGANGSNDIVCLEYGGVEKCAMAGTNVKMRGIAENLRTNLQNRTVYLNLKDEIRALISAGAIQLAPGIVEERSGQFSAQKITYTIDYRNLTIQQMISLGLPPSDSTLRIVRQITYWIDRKTGLIVKSRMAELNGVGFYEKDIEGLAVGNVELPAKNMTRIGSDSFLSFYTQSQQDYIQNAECQAMNGTEKETCFQSIAVNGGGWEACKRIGTLSGYEKCSVIIAQTTHNPAICRNLSLLADDCYIAVAGETGDFELCKSVKNTGLSSNCIEAATAGQKKQEAAAALAAKAYAGRNCANDGDCKVFGNAFQYCAPKNSTAQFANDTDPLYACLEGVPCGCSENYCGFAKNETYYSCMNGVEDSALRAYIGSLIPDNSTANRTALK